MKKSNNKAKFYSRKGKGTNTNVGSPIKDGKGNKPNRGTEGFDDADVSSKNDASLYNRFPQLLKDAASIPYSYLAGAPFSMYDGGTIAVQSQTDNEYIPGVMALEYLPTIGVAGNPDDPVNVAARNIYTYVRHVNSGHTNYDAPDLMMYLLAMDSLINFHSFMKRVYGVARLYSPANRYYPNTLLDAMGVAKEDIYGNLANFRAYINMFAIKLGSLCVPKDMGLYTRHKWMNEGLYVDSSSVKAQTYVFVPKGALVFSNTGVNGSELNYQSYTSLATVGGSAPEALTVNDFMLIGNALMQNIMMDEDFNIMSGDVLKAFGQNGIWMVDTIPEDYRILPSYNLEVLSQIHNAVICDGGIAYYNISQDNTINQGTLVANLAIKLADSDSTAVSYYLDMAKMLNAYIDDMQPADTMVASRLIATGVTKGTYNPTGESQPVSVYRPDTYGSELIIGAYIYYPDTAGSQFAKTSVSNFIISQGGNFTVKSALLAVLRVPQFDWAPQLWLNQNVAGLPSKFVPAFDVNSFTILHKAELMNLHQVAMISLFDVPLTSMSNR